MRRLYRTLFIALIAASLLAASASTALAAPTLLQDDEFNAGPLNTGFWKTVLPWGTQYSSNNEQQWYDPANLSFVNGGLRIKTEKRTVNGWPYASGIVTTKNQYSYGYYEVRAKLAKGKGVWPAIWLLRDGTQEIDIMEMLGDNPYKVYMTYHKGGTQPYQSQYTGPDFSAGYHTFAVDWQPSYIRWYIDGVKRGEYYGSIPSAAQNLILNVAVGKSGSWPGAPDGTTVMPQYMDVDYVRVYSSMPAPGTTTPPTTTPPATWPSTVTYSRLAGTDRYGTAVAVSKKAFPTTAPAVVIASGGTYADALAAGPLAKAYGGPVLLTPQAGLTSAVMDELKRLAPSKVFVVGSPKSVGTAVEGQLATLASKPSVTRLGGIDRFETAGLIADALKAKVGTPTRVVLANGFADALSAAPLAAAKGWPILLTKTYTLPTSTSQAISRSGATSSLVIGSNAVIADSLLGSLPWPARIGGKDRYETCALVADYAVSQGLSYGRIALATGERFPDGLVSAPYLANGSGLLMLAGDNGLATAIQSRITANKATVKTVNSLGSADSLSEAAVSQAATALK